MHPGGYQPTRSIEGHHSMTLLTRIIFCSVVLSLTASALADDPALAARIRGRMQTFIDRKEIAGAVTLVGDADAILSLDAVGLRSIEGKQPMQADTLFRVASMTKPITAMGVMMLVDEGKLAVDDPIEKHLPEFQGIRVIAERSGDSLTLKPPARAVAT
jgi:CubicO group peptidase (beta-lactamase class C family)